MTPLQRIQFEKAARKKMGAFVRSLRKAKGLDMEQVARAGGWTARSQERYEEGMVSFSIELIEKMAEALDESTVTFLLAMLEQRHPGLVAISAAAIATGLIQRVQG